MSTPQSRREVEEALRDAVLDVNETQAAAALAVATRDEIILSMHREDEYSMYRIAQLADLSQTMVRKIVAAAS